MAYRDFKMDDLEAKTTDNLPLLLGVLRKIVDFYINTKKVQTPRLI